jgi:hypothetical protein
MKKFSSTESLWSSDGKNYTCIKYFRLNIQPMEGCLIGLLNDLPSAGRLNDWF